MPSGRPSDVLTAGGELVPNHTLVRQSGQGGYGQVWEAQDKFGKPCVLKLVRDLQGKGRQVLEGLRRVAGLDHPHLLKVEDVWVLGPDLLPLKGYGGKVAEAVVIRTPLADSNLRKLLDDCRLKGQTGIDPHTLIRYLREAADAIDYLHREGIVHRDIKPENLLLKNDHVLVSDFELAELVDRDGMATLSTSSGMTQGYAAPEILTQKKVTTQSDQYSLAVTYHVLRTGRLPFPPGLSMLDLIKAQASNKFDLTALETAERDALRQALSANPAERYSSCRALADALDRALHPQPAEPVPGDFDLSDDAIDRSWSTNSGPLSPRPASPPPAGPRTMGRVPASAPTWERDPRPKSVPPARRSGGWLLGSLAVAAIVALLAAAVVTVGASALWWVVGFIVSAGLLAAGYLLIRSAATGQPPAAEPPAPTTPPVRPVDDGATLTLSPADATTLSPPPPDLLDQIIGGFRAQDDHHRTMTIDQSVVEARSVGDPNRTVTYGQASLNIAAVSHPPTRTLTSADGHAALPDLALVLDKYTLVRHLGEGSFGTVFLAHPKDNPDDHVAIKFFVYGSTRRWRQLQAEVQRLAGLDGVPGIVGLLDVNADADPPHFVMRFAAGGSLADRLRKEGPLPAATVARLAGRIAAALAAVHERGVVHCDLKPGNVLLDEYDQPLLADFGQAQLVGEDAPSLGTLFYMPPDQADPSPRPPDPRWDVYALGALLHALLTGRPPHDETLRAAIDDTVTLGKKLRRYRDGLRSAAPPGDHRRCCPDGRLCGVIDRCLCVDPGERYPDATAVLAELKCER